MKSKELKIYNLPVENVPSSQINAKPTIMFILLILLGIFLFVIKLPYIYGIILITIGVISIGFMPRVTMIEFYSDYLVMYNRADKSTCVIIYYNEVSCWYYTWSASKDTLVIELEDGSKEVMETFSKTLFEAYMSKYLKQKRKKNK